MGSSSGFQNRRRKGGQRLGGFDNSCVPGWITLSLGALGAPMRFLKYLVSTDHKVIGLLYAVTSLCFLLVGFTLVIIMRWQLAYPGEPLPLVGDLFGAANAPGGIVLPEFYNQLGAMHGTIMVFLGVVPLAVGAFGNYLVPLQIGAPDMAFPRLNLASYWFYAAGGAVMLVSFFVPGGARPTTAGRRMRRCPTWRRATAGREHRRVAG